MGGELQTYLADSDVKLYHGDAVGVLRTLPEQSVHMCLTSPPFYGLRDYGTGSWEGGDPDCDHVKNAEMRQPRLADSPASTRGGAKKVAEVSAVLYGTVCGKCGAARVDQQIGLEETPQEWLANLVAVFSEVWRVLRDDGTLWVARSATATRVATVRATAPGSGISSRRTEA